VHIISHGYAGGLLIGNSLIEVTSLHDRADEWSAWADSLTDDADILLYGCDVAATASGSLFIDQLATLTTADVAASTDLTGTATLGGNWVLEASTGPVETSPLVDAAQGYQEILGAVENIDTELTPQSFVQGSTFNLDYEKALLLAKKITTGPKVIKLNRSNKVAETSLKFTGQYDDAIQQIELLVTEERGKNQPVRIR
jgi:hypothetical protein